MGPFDQATFSAAVLLTTPLLLAAIGELFSERAGVLNVGLEGMILMGAFGAYWGQWWTGNLWLGMVAGAAAGVALAAVMALLSITAQADQIVVGVGLNLLALGLTTFSFREVFGDRGEIVLDRMGTVRIPLLSRVPFVGEVLFSQTPATYLTWAIVAMTWFVLYRTTWGLGLRAVGELPAAADTAGINVALRRWQAVMVTGALAGLAGATLSIVRLGLFQENMSAGRGFLALAAVIFGRWKPLGIVGACFVLGGADALQLRLQAEPYVPAEVWLFIGLLGLAGAAWTLTRSRRRASVTTVGALLGLAAIGVTLRAMAPTWSFPPQLWLTLPFVVTLVALSGLAGSQAAPAAIAVQYRRERDV
ncbi:MAG: ABC transporter permease [Acidimicrobiia bacterium]|nr:ABC transporter permease [Acidimicrobiia bacterium]MCL4292758.1 ABC transporter permease [Acidimicrobiia bacterium]